MPEVEQYPIIKEPKLKSRSSRKLLAILFLFFITLLFILFFNSSISKIHEIRITGNKHVTLKQIGQASKLKVGDNFYTFRVSTIEKRIGKFSVVQSVSVHKVFPGEVKIKIKEYKEVAFQVSSDGTETVSLANGTTTPVKGVVNKPILTGWDGKEREKKKLCRALAYIPDDMLADISEIRPNPSVSYPEKIKMYTRSKFEVTTTIGFLPKKIEFMRAIIADKQPGYIIMLDADYHAPYNNAGAE